jgi:hypothetical protein
LSGGCDGLHDVWVEASGQGAFEASDDVEFVAAVGVDVTAHVGPGLVVPDEANDDDAVQGGVGLPVAAAVEPVPVGLAGAGRDGVGAAERGEGGLGVQPFGVVAGGDQQRGGGVWCRRTTSRVGLGTTSRVGLGRVIMSWVHLRRRG